MQNSLIALGLLAALVVYKSLQHILRIRARPPYPPGPKGFPIVGDFHALHPKTHGSKSRWERWLDWSRQYDSPDIVSVSVFGERVIILNTKQAVDDLFEKRSHNYSDRPELMPMMEMSGWAWNFGLMRYSDRWRLHRKTFHQFFREKVVPDYYDIQTDAAARLIQNLANSPQEFVSHVRHYSGSITLKIAYGYDLQNSMSDPYIRLAANAHISIHETSVPGAFLVDFLPALKYVPSWFPGARFKRLVEEWRPYVLEFRDRPWRWQQESMENGKSVSSFVTKSLDRLAESDGPSDDENALEAIKNCAGLAYAAGAETTMSAILSFILNMLRNPDVQARAQSELDMLTQSLGRLPSLEDNGKLPFLDAVIAETLRFNPPLPLGVSHAAFNDDTYEGYFIPKGATIFGNVWAILHDETSYGPEPMRFNPNRFLGSEKRPSPENYAFGSGRRICPGRYLAINTIWIAAIRMLHSFTISPSSPEEKLEVVYSDALISHPSPFGCEFVPRHSG